jgi:hypothetical protein
VTSDASGGIAGRRAVLHVNQAALENASAIRVCQPGPFASDCRFLDWNTEPEVQFALPLAAAIGRERADLISTRIHE